MSDTDPADQHVGVHLCTFRDDPVFPLECRVHVMYEGFAPWILTGSTLRVRSAISEEVRLALTL